MAKREVQIVALCRMEPGQEADLFALLTVKEELRTRDGKPYWRVGFRDAGREVRFPIWNDSNWADACRDEWTPGAFYKLRALYRETSYGPQLDIRRIREAVETDAADGFDPYALAPASRFEPAKMLSELHALVEERIAAGPLQALVLGLLDEHAEALLSLPAATRNHHAFTGGWLEHAMRESDSAVARS